MSDIKSITDILKDTNANTIIKYVGLEIKNAYIKHRCDKNDRNISELIIEFIDGYSYIKIFDNNRICCEERYMTTDDNITDLVGSKLVDVISKTGPCIVKENDIEYENETCFIEIITTGGSIILTNHNIHSGWYSGFDLTILDSEYICQKLKNEFLSTFLKISEPYHLKKPIKII